jgi:hypothetical protein
VSVFKIDPATGERLDLLATAAVGEGDWVDLAEPIIVKAGDEFIAVPQSTSWSRTLWIQGRHMNLVIFDIDGTLTESVAVDEACFVHCGLLNSTAAPRASPTARPIKAPR